jgi:hypothetical protein
MSLVTQSGIDTFKVGGQLGHFNRAGTLTTSVCCEQMPAAGRDIRIDLSRTGNLRLIGVEQYRLSVTFDHAFIHDDLFHVVQ